MMSLTPSADGRLPVFAFPSTLTFYTDDQSSYKQIVTIYNPYDFQFRFKVLSTAPHKYMVVESDGVVKSRCCVDIVIRHTEVCGVNERVRDKFRIQVAECTSKKVLGRKDVTATLLPTKKDDVAPPDEKFETLPITSDTSRAPMQHTIAGARIADGMSSGPNVVIIMAAVTCIVALMLPSQGDQESRLPSYLHMSINQKLIAAYVLGLVTMVLLRT